MPSLLPLEPNPSLSRPNGRGGAPVIDVAAAADELARLRAHCERLQIDNELLRQAFAEMPHGLCMFDAADRLLLANDRYLEIWGLPAHLGRPGTTFAEIMQATRGSETERSRNQPGPLPGMVGMRKREWLLDDGRTIEVVVRRRADGACIALHEDVTAQRQVQERIAYLARHDPLTGLRNRAVLLEALELQLRRVDRGEEFALLCLDLDRFKPVNDTLGHAAGDLLLRGVADRLRAAVRGVDVVARLGGDEFAILQCGAAQPGGSTVLARRIIESLAAPFEIHGQAVHIGVSVGIAVAPFDGDESEALLRNADLALYRAKGEGRGTLRYFEPEMDQRVRERRSLEADLRCAVDAGQLRLHYQLQVDALGRHVRGVETLLRWEHPERGLVPPGEFIALAEETGLIVPIGRWVLAQACQDALDWPADVRVAVNVSAAQFRHGGLLRDVAAALHGSGLAPARLELEITESVMLQDTAQVLETLRTLRERGVRVAMDDFGTGYSSLSHLRSFPFDRIKVDRSFVRDLETNGDSMSIVRAIAQLGHSLGIAVTVEGIETAGQWQIAEREGCDEMQGFLFGRPVPAADLRARLQAPAGTAASRGGEEG